MGEFRTRYDVFLSYSHAADLRIAAVLRRGLHQLTRRWNQFWALRVFRDKESLAANPDLWSTIDEALRGSRFFILLASREAAVSPWVSREVEYWRSKREQSTFLIALTGGKIVWDDDAGDFDWEETTALPEALRGWFSAEPLWVDLSWARNEPELSLRHSGFRFDVATLAAAVHGKPKEELDSEDVRRHRVTTWVRRGVATALTVLLVAVLGLGARTVLQQQEAIEQGRQALSRAVAAKSELVGDSDPELSRLLALAAWRVRETPEAEVAMLQAVGRSGFGRIISGGGSVETVVFGPDGGTVVTGGDDVRMWDVATRQQIGNTITGHEGAAVQTVRFSPDGGTLLVAGEVKTRGPNVEEDPSVRLWDIETGDKQRLIEPDQKDADSPIQTSSSINAAFSPDGAMLVLGGPGPRVTMWDIAREKAAVTAEIPQVDPYRRNDMPPSVAFHPNGSLFAALGTDGHIRFWDASTGQMSGSPLSAHPGDNASQVGPVLVYSPTGDLFATGGTDGTIRFWDTVTRQPVGAPLTGHTRPNRVTLAQSLAFSRDGHVLAAGSEDGTVRLWDVRTHTLLGSPLSGHTSAVTSVAFSPDGRTLASGARDGTARLWNVAERLQLAHPAIEHSGMLYALAFSPDSKTLVTGGDNGETVGDHRSMEACAHDGWGVCYADNGNTIAFDASITQFFLPPSTRRQRPGPPRTLMLWDAVQRKAVTDLPTRDRTPVMAVAFSPDGATVVAGGANCGEGDAVFSDANRPIECGPGDSTTVWDPTNHTQRTQPLSDQLSLVRATAFSPDGNLFVLAGRGKNGNKPTELGFWDAKTYKQIGAVDIGETVYTVAFSPDGSILATGNDRGEIRLWGVNSRKPVGEVLAGHSGPVGALAFSPDGAQLASAGDDGLIRLWDTTGRQLAGDPLVGHSGVVYSLAFHPDGRTLASGGGDGSVRLWHVSARKQFGASHVGHQQPVRAVAFSPDGKTLATAGEDAAVRFWDVRATKDVPASLCETAQRSLSSDEWHQHLSGADFEDVCPSQ